MLPLPPDTYRVSQLGFELRDFLAEAFSSIWVGGELHRARRARSGHFYFELVEKGTGDEIVGKVDAVLFRRDWMRVERNLRRAGVQLEEGTTVRCFGTVDFYPNFGRLQLIVRDIDPTFALGALAQRREETLSFLAARNLLDQNAALDLDPLPRRLGLVTSVGSAAFEDFASTLRASGYAFELVPVDTRVQGPGADRQIALAVGALSRLDPLPHAIVLIRGGGSRADLAAFDSREVAEAVATAPVPVLTGLGHEIDTSIADRVAYKSFKTPTGVAEFLVQRLAGAEAQLLQLQERLPAAARRRLQGLEQQLARIGRGLAASRHRLRGSARRLDGLEEALTRAGRRQIAAGSRQLQSHARSLLALAPKRLVQAEDRCRQVLDDVVTSARHRLKAQTIAVKAHERLCRQLSPQRTLERGFSLTRTAAGELVRRSGQAPAGTEIVTRLATGRLTSTVTTAADDVESDLG